jgi:hypothetical protein
MGTNCLISIGNSDDKLSQGEWSRFVMEMRDLLRSSALQIHGEWFSLPDQPWQNANWCVEVPEPAWWRVAVERAGQDENAMHPEHSASAVHMRLAEMKQARRDLKYAVRDLCYRWRQDSFAWTEAPVQIVETGFPATPQIQEVALPFPPEAGSMTVTVDPSILDEMRANALKHLNVQRDTAMEQAQREGWATTEAQLIQAQPTLGEDKGSDQPQPASTGEGDNEGTAGVTMKPSKARALRQKSRHEAWHNARNVPFEECPNEDCVIWRGVL